MKKIIPLLVSALMLLSLAACGSKTTTPETTTAPAASGKTLVIYFSATGNTKAAAEAIAAATGGDLLELEPAEPYTSADLDYNNADSRVSREHDDETLRDVALKTTTSTSAIRSGGASPRGRWTRSSRPMTLPARQSSPSAPPAAATSARAARSLRHSPAPVTGRRASASHPPSRSRKLPTGSSPSANNLSGAKLHSPAIGFFRWPGIFSNLYLIYARFFAISLNLCLEYAIFFLSGSAGFRDSSYRHCTAADHAAGKPVESERMTRYAA